MSRSEKLKKLWEGDEYRSRQRDSRSIAMLRRWQDPEQRKLMLAATSRQRKPPRKRIDAETKRSRRVAAMMLRNKYWPMMTEQQRSDYVVCKKNHYTAEEALIAVGVITAAEVIK